MRVFCFCILPLLFGCATRVQRWNVTTFHDLGPVAGKTYVIVPSKPDSVQTLEFATYARSVEDGLKRHQLVRRPFAEFGSTDLVFVLEYGAGEPKKELLYSPEYGALSTQPGIYTNGVYGVTPPTGVVGVTTKSVTSYPKHVQLLVFDGKNLAPGQATRRFEAVARTEDEEANLPHDVLRGITAILEDFPGTNASTSVKVFRIAPNKPQESASTAVTSPATQKPR